MEPLDGDDELRMAPPPPHFTPVRRWVLDDAVELQGLRSGIEGEITAWGARNDQSLEHVADTLVLLASELATNAIRHGRPPSMVELCQHETRFLLTVTDHDTSGVPEVAHDRPPEDGGLGLLLTTHLSEDAGWYLTPAAKIVWATLTA